MVALLSAVWSGSPHTALTQESDSGLDAPLEAFRQAYEHEKHVSKLIADLVQQSRQVGDTSTETFRQWFVTEQVDEEAQTYRIAQKLQLAGDERTVLL